MTYRYNKEPCRICNKDGITNDVNCKSCNGEGFHYFIDGKCISKEEFRELYNTTVNYEDAHSNDYCLICNRFIKYSNKSVEEGICEFCYNYKQNVNDAEEEMRRKELQNKLKEKLLEEISIRKLYKDELKGQFIKGSRTMSFIEFENVTIHIDDIIKVQHLKYQEFWKDDKKMKYKIEIYTRDGQTHELNFQNEDECIEKYKKFQDIIKASTEIHVI